MQQLALFLAISLLTSLFSGCVHSKTISYSSESLDPKPESFQMEILDPQNVDRPYKVIGTVEANAGARFNVEDPIEKLREEARKMGADALLAPTQTPIGMGYSSSGTGSYSGHVRDLFVCKAIVWMD
jgi:hypothetical protein